MDSKVLYSHREEDLIYDHCVNTNHRRVGISAHTHNAPEILFLKDGDVNFIIDGKKFNLKKNDLVITPPLAIHEINFESDQNYERYVLIFD